MNASWLNLEGKTIIVTGGASGIGRAVSEELLQDGANVVVCDMNPNAPVFEEAKEGQFLYTVTNVTDAQSVNAMIEKTMETYGRIDAIVNNAGINIPRLLVDEGEQYELDEAVWDKVMNVNLKGVFLCAQAAGHVMVKQGSGVIINMSSESGLEGSEGQSVYAASKNAVNSLTRSWAKELGKKGVRVVGVAPGILEATGLRTLSYETALAYTRGISIDELRAGYAKTSTTPMGRSGKLSEVANAVAFLCSDRASYIHGVTINVAGGKTRGEKLTVGTIVFLLRDVTYLSVFLRITVSLILGGVIGLERGLKNRPAGLRTYMLVCVGACLIMLTNQYIYQVFQVGDPVRMGAQVVSGIGFLGAGTIVVTKHSQIKGLTTAAGLWTSAAVGLAVGIGFYEAAFFGGAMIVAILTILHRWDDVMHRSSKAVEIYVELENSLSLGDFMQQIRMLGLEISEIQLEHDGELSTGRRSYLALLKAKKRVNHAVLTDSICQINGVAYLEEL